MLSVSRESDVFILPQKTAKNSLDPCRKGMQMKKWCMTLLAVAVFSMCMCGCGSPKTVLRWAMFGSFQDMTKCQKAVNEKLQEKGIDCEIEFVNIPSEYDGDYGEYLKPYWSALEEGGYDIVGMLETWSYLDMYQTAIDRGLLLPLDPMLEERETGKKLRGAYPENMWVAMKLGGSIYGVATPGLEFHCYLVFNQEYAEKYHLDPDKVSEDNLEDYLRTAMEGERAEGNDGFVPIKYLPYLPVEGYESSLCSFIEFDVSGEKPAAKNILYEEAYLSRIRTLTDWQKEGMIVTEDNGAVERGNFLAEIVYSYSAEAAECEMAWRTGGSIRLHAVGFPKFDVLTCFRGAKTGVAASGKQKEEAFDVLAEICSDRELSNALVYGTEGEDYELADGQAVRHEGELGDYLKRYFGNSLLTLPGQKDPPDKCQKVYGIVEQLPLPKLTSWSFDISGVETELDQLNEYYYSEYMDFFSGGSADWDRELEELRRTTKELGIDRVIEEMDAQLAEWEGR